MRQETFKPTYPDSISEKKTEKKNWKIGVSGRTLAQDAQSLRFNPSKTIKKKEKGTKKERKKREIVSALLHDPALTFKICRYS